MCRMCFSAAYVSLVLWCGISVATAQPTNRLAGSGFEETPPGVNVQPILGWSAYGPNTFSETDATRAHTGSNYFKVYGSFSGANNWNGIYQDVPCGPGAVYQGQVWFCSLATDAIHGQDQFWVEVTFRDIAGNALALYRSALITGNNIGGYGGLSAWFPLLVTNQWAFYNNGGSPIATALTNTVSSLIAPAQTFFVRYQIVFYQGPDNANGSAYVDDCALTELSGPTNPPAPAWNIVWSDEFSGTTINTNSWSFETGNGSGGWGNNELEYYTSRPQNAYVSNGLLHIVALRESYAGFNYTSARMKTQGHFSKTYGRFEFRARLPAGLGFWPALWLLGTNISTVGWPACGEIDVMENNGNTLNRVQGTLHYSDALNHHLQSTAVCTLPGGGSVTNFHSYVLEWQTNLFRWYVDGLLFETQSSWSSSTGPYPAPFNQPFFLLLNLAVGGNYLGNPSIATINANTLFPGDMQVDYVRVWDLTPPLRLWVTPTNGNLLLNWATNIVCHLQMQTNSLSLTDAWTDLPQAAPPFLVTPLVGGSGRALYRLKSP